MGHSVHTLSSQGHRGQLSQATTDGVPGDYSSDDTAPRSYGADSLGIWSRGLHPNPTRHIPRAIIDTRAKRTAGGRRGDRWRLQPPLPAVGSGAILKVLTSVITEFIL